MTEALCPHVLINSKITNLDFNCANSRTYLVAFSSFPFATGVVRKARYAAFVEVYHVHHAVDLADHFGGAHISQRFS